MEVLGSDLNVHSTAFLPHGACADWHCTTSLTDPTTITGQNQQNQHALWRAKALKTVSPKSCSSLTPEVTFAVPADNGTIICCTKLGYGHCYSHTLVVSQWPWLLVSAFTHQSTEQRFITMQEA